MPRSALNILSFKVKPKPSRFGITSIISDKNQGGPYRKPGALCFQAASYYNGHFASKLMKIPKNVMHNADMVLP